MRVYDKLFVGGRWVDPLKGLAHVGDARGDAVHPHATASESIAAVRDTMSRAALLAE
jgi:hypothetical protein